MCSRTLQLYGCRNFGAAVIIILLTLLYFGCSYKIAGAGNTDLSFEPLRTNAWVNLMPGRKTTFHLVVEGVLINKSQLPVENILIDSAIVYQHMKKIFGFKPFVIWPGKDTSIHLADTLKFNFRNEKGIPVEKGLDIDDVIDVFILFSYNGKMFDYMLKNIKLEKVY